MSSDDADADVAPNDLPAGASDGEGESDEESNEENEDSDEESDEEAVADRRTKKKQTSTKQTKQATSKKQEKPGEASDDEEEEDSDYESDEEEVVDRRTKRKQAATTKQTTKKKQTKTKQTKKKKDFVQYTPQQQRNVSKLQLRMRPVQADLLDKAGAAQTYEVVTAVFDARGQTVLTTKAEFDAMEGPAIDRKIRVKCQFGCLHEVVMSLDDVIESRLLVERCCEHCRRMACQKVSEGKVPQNNMVEGVPVPVSNVIGNAAEDELTSELMLQARERGSSVVMNYMLEGFPSDQILSPKQPTSIDAMNNTAIQTKAKVWKDENPTNRIVGKMGGVIRGNVMLLVLLGEDGRVMGFVCKSNTLSANIKQLFYPLSTSNPLKRTSRLKTACTAPPYYSTICKHCSMLVPVLVFAAPLWTRGLFERHKLVFLAQSTFHSMRGASL